MTLPADYEPIVTGFKKSLRHSGDMKICDGLDAVLASFERSSLTIGNFDGVHRGHQALIRRTVEDARAHGRAAVVLTFDRHPLELFRPELAPKRLTTPDQQNALIASLGVDALIVARFDCALAEMSADQFITDIVKGRLGAEAIVEGPDFCFGKGRSGDLALLHRAQEEYGFTLHVANPLNAGGMPISSTRIRELVRAGQIAEAEELLGHEFRMAGRVVCGQRYGRTLRRSSVNLESLIRQIVPPDGSYIARATLEDGREFDAACTIGGEAGRFIETILIGSDDDLCGQEVTLRFVHRLGVPMRYDSLNLRVAALGAL